MKEIPVNAKSEGPHECTFDTKHISCKCSHGKWNRLDYDKEFWNKYADENESRNNKEFTKELQELFMDTVMGENKKFRSWLKFI